MDRQEVPRGLPLIISQKLFAGCALIISKQLIRRQTFKVALKIARDAPEYGSPISSELDMAS
jgi:hypothetical protein